MISELVALSAGAAFRASVTPRPSRPLDINNPASFDPHQAPGRYLQQASRLGQRADRGQREDRPHLSGLDQREDRRPPEVLPGRLRDLGRLAGGPFTGTFISLTAPLTLATLTAPAVHTGAFYARDITVNPDNTITRFPFSGPPTPVSS
jgi:hypothetical protein